MSSNEHDPKAPSNDSSRAPADDWSIIEGFRRGDAEAVEEVHRRIERIIAFRGYRIPRDDQDGLRQEVLIQVWQGVNRDGFNPDLGFWGFVQTITARRCIDWMRRRVPKIVDDFEAADSAHGPLGKVLEREQRTTAARVLEQLSPACREVIDLRFAKEKSYAEIANLLGRSEQALRAQVYRCIGKARDLLGGARSDATS